MDAVARPKAEKSCHGCRLRTSREQRSNAGWTSGQLGPPSSMKLFGTQEPNGIREPNAIQRAAAGEPVDEQLVIIESETGSGKTEAALWRFARMYREELVDGLYFALPTRSAAVQLHGRVLRFVEAMFPEEARPAVVLAVPGYEPDPDAEAVALGYNPEAAGVDVHSDTEGKEMPFPTPT